MSLYDAIAFSSNARFPEEACGFILDSGEMVACDNVAADPLQSFVVHPEQAKQWRGQAVAVWHSHCFDPAVPSEDDERRAVPGLECWIYSVPDEDLGVYVRVGDKLQLKRMENRDD